MPASLSAILQDPLLIKEFRTRMRARTVLIVELLYIVAICGIVFLGYLFTRSREDAPGWELGSALFRTITYVQAVLMFFVSPLVSASAISGEKEQKTFDSLCVTPVSPRRILVTKLVAALGCFVVLILSGRLFRLALRLYSHLFPDRSCRIPTVRHKPNTMNVP